MTPIDELETQIPFVQSLAQEEGQVGDASGDNVTSDSIDKGRHSDMDSVFASPDKNHWIVIT